MKQPYEQGPSSTRPAAIAAPLSCLKKAGALLLSLGMAFGAQAQSSDALFRTDVEAQAAAAGTPLAAALAHARPLTLDLAGLRAALATAPLEGRAEAPLVLALPLPDGTTQRFALREAPVMEPGLAASFPQIKTYAGRGLDDAGASVRLDLTPQGFHAQVLTGAGNSYYIDPASRTDTRHYLAFYKRDMNRAGTPMSCSFAPSVAELKASQARVAAFTKGATGQRLLASGSQLKTYRLAVAATGEYTAFHGGTVALAQAAIITTVNRVVGVYEKELAVRMVLVANNSSLVYTNAATDPYTNNDGFTMLGQNQTNVDAIIGSSNYDIGHVVSTGGGGVAGLGVVCRNNQKAQGVTGSSSPVGDSFDIDYVAHEIGHQFGGNHTFNNNDAGSCSGNRNNTTAYEPGSGSTIMAYAGICGSANDLQPHSDPIFHTGNYQEMRAFIVGTTCGTTAATGNTAPVVTAPASGLTLPIGTPFKLTASATDAENDPLTYLWEEMDLGAAGSPTSPQVAGQNVPLFRSFVPTASSTRYFPRLSDLVNNTTVLGERLPTVTRTLKFRCTARDEHSGPVGVIGGVDYSPLVTLNVSSVAGPFLVTAPNTAVTWAGGAAQNVTWNVAGTSTAPVSCATVNIRLSLDGGLTYPTVLATNEANDGSAVVVLPNTASTTARIMVEAADNYFFDISNTNFTITASGAAPTITSFTPGGGLPGTVVTILGANFTGATAVRFNGTNASSFTVNSATQITATVAAGTTTGTITVTGLTGTGTSATAFVVGAPPTVTSFNPTSGAVGSTVVITGTNFTGATQVTFNGTAATAYTVNSATQITATVPTGATTGPIAVTTPVATGTSSSNFTVLQAPVVTSFTPGSGSAGTVVTISGGFFTGATQVTFNGTAATIFTVNSASTITVTVPTGATTGPIAVTTANGTGTSSTDFVVPPANDLCANAIALACGQTVTGSTLGATSTGDPTATCGTSVDGGGVFYTITGTGTNITLTTCNAATDYDTKLFVYSGTCGTYTCVGGDDDSGCGTTSTVTFASITGTVYRIFVSGYGGDEGTFALTATCTAPPAPDLVVSTGSLASPVSVAAGTYNSLTVTGTGVAQLTGAGVFNSSITVQGGGVLLTNCQPITGAATFTLAAGATLGICDPAGITASGATGAVQVTGSRSYSSGASYLYNGTAAQVTGAGLPSQVLNLATVNSNAVTLSAPVAVVQAVGLNNGNLVLNGNMLTLLSSPAGTALVVNNGTGFVTGTATVQRYLDPSVNAGLGYRHLAPAVGGSTVADLATATFTPEVSQGAAYNSSATPTTVTPFPTVFGYDQNRILSTTNNLSTFDKGFVAPTSLADPLATGRGYVVNMAAGQVVDFVGTLRSGSQFQSLVRNGTVGPQAGWYLLGNPYPSPIDYSLIPAADRPNLDASMYVFESTSQYNGTYRAYVNGVGNSLIGTAQGFWVRVSDGQAFGTITFNNTCRVTSYATQVPVRRNSADLRPQVQLTLRGASGAADDFYAYAETGATLAYDAQYDALKLPNTTGLNLSSAAGSGEALAIDGRAAFTAGTVLPLTVGVPAAGTYTLAAAALANLPAGLDPLLTDALTGQSVNLRTQPTYAFSVNAAQAAGPITGRFSLRFSASALASASGLSAAQVSLFPNPAHSQFTVQLPGSLGAPAVQAELLNALGQVVRRHTAAGASFQVETTGLATGVYTLRLLVNGTSLAKRVVVQ